MGPLDWASWHPLQSACAFSLSRFSLEGAAGWQALQPRAAWSLCGKMTLPARVASNVIVSGVVAAEAALTRAAAKRAVISLVTCEAPAFWGGRARPQGGTRDS